MSSNLTPQDIAECICALIARNKLWNGKKVRVNFIVNKTAGCFTNSHKSDKYKRLYNQILQECKSQPECTKSISYKLFSTEYAGHAKDLTRAVVAQLIATDEADCENLIVTAGGDGTSLEVQTALYKCAMEGPKQHEAITTKLTILRLPLGTGNDGTDGHTVEENIDLLKGGLVFTNAKAVLVYPENEPTEDEIRRSANGKQPEKYQDIENKAPWYTFNIASMGLDAYVVYMTNLVKKKLPGNFYHLCVPLSGFVYDKDFPSGRAKIEMFDLDGNKTGEAETPITLMAFGASGYRVYGGGHKILPNEHNLCICPKVSLLTLIKENHRFVDGSFVGTNLASLHTAEKIRVSYDKPILMQCDGETVMLSPAHFPLIMERTEPCLRVLQKV